MQRRMFAPIVLVASLLIVSACGSDEPVPQSDTELGVDVTDTGDASAATEAPADDAGAADTVAPAGDTGDTVAPADGSSGSSDSGDGASAPVGNPAIGKFAELETEEMCALFPEAEVEGVVGVDLEPGTGTFLQGLGTNCLFYDNTGEFQLVAKFEFGAIPWSAVAALALFTPDGSDPAEECTVGGREAYCVPATEGDFTVDAAVYVKLGTDDDIALYASSTKGLDAAKALAEYGLTKVPL